MTNETSEKRPGDLFLDRYMPTASDEEREEAYENLRGLIAILIEIDDRLTREKRARRDSRKAGAQGKIRVRP